jgi:hypothetical protein
MAPEVSEFIVGFIFAIVGITVGAYMLGPLTNATANIPAQYSWVGGIVTLVAAVGLLMFAVKAFGIS